MKIETLRAKALLKFIMHCLNFFSIPLWIVPHCCNGLLVSTKVEEETKRLAINATDCIFVVINSILEKDAESAWRNCRWSKCVDPNAIWEWKTLCQMGSTSVKQRPTGESSKNCFSMARHKVSGGKLPWTAHEGKIFNHNRNLRPAAINNRRQEWSDSNILPEQTTVTVEYYRFLQDVLHLKVRHLILDALTDGVLILHDNRKPDLAWAVRQSQKSMNGKCFYAHHTVLI